MERGASACSGLRNARPEAAYARIERMNDVRVTRAVAATLRVFLNDPAVPMHGYRLMQVTGYPSGKTYPILARLEAAGWLASEMEEVNTFEVGRPARRLYRLTTEGTERATRELANLRAEIV